MRYSSLQEKLSPARIGAYHGAEAAAVFPGVPQEFEALRSAAGLYEATWRAKIVVTGEDRVRWLNGMVTNNVRDLAPGSGVYSFVLNPQGRIQGDLTAFHRGDYFLLVTDESQSEALTAWFDRYIIMDDVELANVSEKLASIGIKGPKAVSILQSAGLPADLQPLTVVDATWNGVGISVARGASERFPEFEIWFAPENTAAIWEALTAAGAQPVGYEALELLRIATGIPVFGQDIRERDLPQETRQDLALHYAKGCYIGQEIVERIHSRGNVHRGLIGFHLSKAVEPGTKLVYNGKEVGEITSIAELPSHKIIALGYLRREAEAAPELTAGEATAVAQKLPFEI
ncbi:MAG TPA: folate-binding protein [Candidatus Koribacter sp.]